MKMSLRNLSSTGEVYTYKIVTRKVWKVLVLELVI